MNLRHRLKKLEVKQNIRPNQSLIIVRTTYGQDENGEAQEIGGLAHVPAKTGMQTIRRGKHETGVGFEARAEQLAD